MEHVTHMEWSTNIKYIHTGSSTKRIHKKYDQILFITQQQFFFPEPSPLPPSCYVDSLIGVVKGS